MEISVENTEPETNRPGPLLAVLHKALGVVTWLDWFFTVTDEDRLQAGVNENGEGRDE
jgi:hypothetical protein